MVTYMMPPGSIGSDAYGFGAIAGLNDILTGLKGQTVHVDFSRVRWIDGHLPPALGTIFEKCATRSNEIYIDNPSAPIKSLLARNGLLKNRETDAYNTIIPLKHFRMTEGKEFSMFAKKHLSRPEMPKMTVALAGKFYEGVDELFANCALHSSSDVGITVGGQFYPKSKRLCFALSDGGRGIWGALQAVGHAAMAHEDAIAWAMEPGNTTRQGDIPGGLGSKILREFVALNGGALTVASGLGFWEQIGSLVRKSPIRCAFPGTAVILSIDTSDRKSYDLVGAPDPRNIW